MAVVIVVTGYRPEKVFDWWLENVPPPPVKPATPPQPVHA